MSKPKRSASHSLTAANQVIWIREMESYRKAEYPKMQNLSPEPKPTEEDQALATQVMTDVLKSYPDVQGVFAMTSVALPGAAEALRAQKAADRVFLTGLSTPKSMRAFERRSTGEQRAQLWEPHVETPIPTSAQTGHDRCRLPGCNRSSACSCCWPSTPRASRR